MKEMFSVIVLSYNNSQYLKGCLDSIFKQTYPNIEIIVADDCSNSFDEEDKTFIIQKNSILEDNSVYDYKDNSRSFDSDEEFNFIDESLVNISLLDNGGILDNSELNKINNILKEEKIHNEIELEKSDWKDISSIIDDALEEVREYEFDLAQNEAKTYNLVLNKFDIEELRPFLEKFDQTIINRLVSGETVDVKISLKENQNGK